MVDLETVSILTQVDICCFSSFTFSGMADRGMGIRLFQSKEDLQQIFESFEEYSDGSDDDERHDGSATDVVTSQLRHFVIQVQAFAP